jgi:hypothetical protein
MKISFPNHRPVKPIGVFLFFTLIFSWYFFITPFVTTDDQFFSIRYAQELREQGREVLDNFDTYAFATKQSWSTNVGFYYFLSFFTFFDDLSFGIKAFSVFVTALLFTSFYVFLRVRAIVYPFVSTIFLATVPIVFFAYSRFLQARAYTLSLVLLILLLVALQKQKKLAVFLLSFLYPFIHTPTFFFPLGVVFLYSLAEGLYEKKWHGSLVAAAFGGTILSLLASVWYLPEFASFLVLSTEVIWGTIASVNGTAIEAIDQGLEVYPIYPFEVAVKMPILFFFFVLSVAGKGAELWTSYSQKQTTKYFALDLTVLLLAVGMLLGTALTGRFIDYFIVFSTLLVALFFLGFSGIQEYLKTQKIMLGGLLCVSVFFYTGSVLKLYDESAGKRPYNAIESAAKWLQKETPSKTIVFNPTMNLVPALYFFNGPYTRVIIGAEPRALYAYDKELYWKWYSISNRGYVCKTKTCPEKEDARKRLLDEKEKTFQEMQAEEVYQSIRRDFQSEYVLLPYEFTVLEGVLASSKDLFEKVHETPLTKNYSIYKLLPQ